MNNWSTLFNNVFFYRLLPPVILDVYYSGTTTYTVQWLNMYSGLCWTEIYLNKNGSSFTRFTATSNPSSFSFSIQEGANVGVMLRALPDLEPTGIYHILDIQSPESFPFYVNTPLIMMTNQNILTPVVFQTFNIAAVGTVVIDWDDTNITILTGNNINVTHNYGAISPAYYIKIRGDLDKITSMESSGNLTNFGTNLIFWNLPLGRSAISMKFDNCSFTSLPQGDFQWMSVYNFQNNLCTGTVISNFLMYLDNYFLFGVVPKCNCTYTLDGAGMGAVNAAGLAAKASIQAKYVAAGFVATINNN
jgi:hypothetical protein